MFRVRPELARALLERCCGVALPTGESSLATIDASQASPVEARADVVVAIRDNDAVVAAIVVEVQRSVDADKRLKWPLYVSALRARLGCPVMLLVLTSDLAVGRWARAPIAMGHPGWDFTPIVIDYADVARVPEDQVGDPPELAVLYARANPTPTHAILAMAALARVGAADLRRLYWSFLSQGLSPTLRAELEIDMDPEKIRSLLEHYTELNLKQQRADEEHARAAAEERSRAIEERARAAEQEGRSQGELATQRSIVRRALANEGRLDEQMERLVEQASAAKLAQIIDAVIDRTATACELLTRPS